MILNDEQRKAVYAKDKNIFLLAGAGSGKTRVIIERINNLLNEVNPEDILCITFTVKSSLEMKKRLLNKEVNVFTFHGYCYQVLNKDMDINLYEGNEFFSSNDLLKISNYKNSVYQNKKPVKYNLYQKYLKESNLIDFDDLIILALNKEHFKYKYIFIDEFQDTNYLQYELIKKLNHSDLNLFAVGDPDQSIYKFRGSKVQLISSFIKDFKAKVYKLEENFRSKNEILFAANNLIKNNLNRFKKTLITKKKIKGSTQIYIDIVDNNILKIVEIIKSRKYKDIAILYRNNYQVYKLKQVLERHYVYHVSFYTFHESKGLEFDTVIIYGAEVMPFDKEKTFESLEEERRLFFVAITRAKTNLFIFTTNKTKFIKELKI